MLNFVLLATCICIIIVLILFLFYWNRFFAFILGLLFRLYSWNQEEASVWLSIGSVHFSILSGRILFKDLRYHSSNQTFRIVKGQVSWRYWLRSPAEEEDLSHARVVGEDINVKHQPLLPCRIHMSFQGLEWFMYNRTAAFDNIIKQLDSEIPDTPAPTPIRLSTDGRGSILKIFSRTSGIHDSSVLGPPVSLISSIYKRTPTIVKRAANWLRLQLPNLDPKDLLPISIEATKGAIICGNASTPNLLVAEFNGAEGTYGIVEARSKHDLYKQMLNIKFQNASACYVENTDYHAPMSDIGHKVHEHIRDSHSSPLRQSTYLSFLSFQRLWSHLKLWTVDSSTHPRSHTFFPRASVTVPHPPSWGRKKHHMNADDETPLGADFAMLEYAIERKFMEAPTLELLYYADVVGVVPIPEGQQSVGTESLDPFDIGNGDLPPEWGIDIVVRGGSLRYGPWADHQRVILQRAFFPQVYHDVEPAPRLKPGDTRKWTGLKIFIELRDGVALQIPFRESSKNWQWDGKVDIPNRPRKREAASIHVRAGDSSTISYVVPMVAGAKGYQSSLEVHLDTVSVTSSLNDIRLVMAETCRVRCHLPTPLTWNGKRQWTFAISLRQPSLYLLRDHVNMLTDLGKDWSSGPPSDYCLFVPMMYVIDLDMHNYEINTYVNDHNIIDKPLIKEENALLTLRGTHFRHGTQLPLTKYRPDATTVSFWIEAPDVAVSLTLPRWNTSGLYPTPDRSDLGHISMLHLDASYRYHAETRKNNIDHLKLEFSAHDVVYTVFGWSIRYFMILRDNYFGSFTHFSTLFEYLEKRKNGQFIGDPIKLQYREGHSNAMQVELGVNVDAGLMVLPAGLPGYETYSADQSNSTDSDLGSCLMLFMPEIQLQLRTCDYYMEMSLNVATISGRIDEHDIKKPLSYATISRKSKETFVIDGIDIIANRLFGPQPHTSTYVCIWEIHIADVKAVLSVHEGRLLSAVGTSFGLNFSDPLNAPAKEYTLPTDPDVTFLKVSLDSLNVVWVAGNAAAELSLPDGLRIDSNDLAGNSYRKVFCFRLPLANVKALLAPNKHTPIWYEAADLKLDANLDIYSAPAGWRESAVAQTKFVIAQDALTERAKVLYDSDSLSAEALRPGHGALVSDDYLPQLRIPRRSAHTSEGDHAVRFDSNLKHPFSYSSSQVDQSESDAEDGLPDALRDARIANSRPTSAIPVTPHNDNESMSSGDESDNDDLTDPQEWTTDYSDTLDDASLDVPWPSVKWYSRLARHYCGQALTRPSFWSNSPFSLSRNVIHQDWQYKYTFGRQTAVEETLKPLPDWSELGHHEDPNADQTVIRLHLKDGVNIGLNPLILPAVTALMKDISMNQLSPELRFDAIMAQFIQSFPSSIGSRSRTTLFDLHLSSARIRSTQFVEERPRENTLGKASTSKNPGASEYASSVVDICLVGFCLRGRVARSNPDAHVQQAFACSFDSLSAALVTESTSQTAHRDDRGSMCHIAFERGYGSLIGHKIIVSLGGISTGIGHTAPEHLFATAVVVAKYGLGLVKVQKRLIVHTPALDQQIIHQVLTYSRQRSVVDPLSTIQPSYLVQTGRPDSLRKDVAFKFLVYLRNCLRYLDHRERRTIVNLHPDLHSVVALEDILMMLEDQWLNLGGDDYASELSQQPLLRELFPTHGSEIRQLSTKDDRSLDCFEIRLDALNFVIYHPSDGTQSDLSLGPLVISVNRQAGDLLQSWMWTPGKSYPNLSLREKERVDALRIIACSFSLGNVASTIYPQAMQFTQIVLRVNRHYGTRLSLPDDHSSGPHVSERTAVATTNNPVVYLVLATSIRSLRFTAAAHRLIFRFKTCAVTYASTLLAKPPSVQRISWDISTNHSLVFVQSSLQACSALDTTKLDDRDVLASLTLTDGRINAVVHRESQGNISCRLLLGLEGCHLNVPRSALRLYRFVEEWRADYLPGIDATVRALLSELHKPSGQQPAPTPRPSISTSPIAFQLHASVSSFRVTLQVMHGTWLSWDVRQTIAFTSSHNDTRRKGVRVFGLQMGPHIFCISKTQGVSGVEPILCVRLELPTLTLRGQFDEAGIQGLALVEFFHVTVKPSDWDTLLSVQQKSGQDFNDLLHIIEQTRKKRSPSTPEAHSISQQTPSFNFSGSLKMKGFRIGLEGLSSTLFLECDDIIGGLGNNNRSVWQVKLSDLALSLASRSGLHKTFDRDRRSAFVTMDFEASMGRQATGSGQQLQVSIAKVHAVMQPSSIGELGDFVDHLQAEVLIRKEQRATELAEFKEKTKSLMRSLDVKIGETQVAEASWLDMYTFSLAIRNIGVAFPLTLNQNLQMPRSTSQDTAAVRAFLFSIKSLEFGTEQGESGQAAMKGFSFQFVSRFRQSNATDFSGDTHKTRNRLVYPEMTAHLHSERVSGSRRIRIGADVSGFILDVDSTIPDFISSLIDVYRHGKDRMERLANNIPRSSPNAEKLPHIETVATEKQYRALPTSNVLASLTFASGKVRMHSRQHGITSSRARPLSTLIYGLSEELVLGAEEFDLPVVSVWIEFRATPASRKLSVSTTRSEPSTLLFKSTIHSSQNTLRPTLLPFLSELMDNVENHMRQSSWRNSQISPARTHELLPSVTTGAIPARDSDPVSSMKISFSLRIDQSKLHLTCRPDANVVAGLHWDSGGFIVNISRGAQHISFTGTVGGLTVWLRHGFLSEDCVRLDARNLAFAIAFAKVESQPDKVSTSVSVVVDTEFSGGIRFSRLQDVLCFKAVWLDRIPVFAGRSISSPGIESSKSAGSSILGTSSSAKQELTTAVLMRLRQVHLDIDLGQSITNIKLKLDDTLIRTKITEASAELSLSITKLSILATGNVSGQADLPDFRFQTIRKSESHHDNMAGSRMLDLTMTSGGLNIKLESEYHELIHYRAEPLAIMIFDDWSRIAPEIPVDDRRVHLSFVVSGTEVVAVMNVGTIPKLVSYVNKFTANLETQREGARRESKALGTASTPKPNNPLSAVASVMLKSARTRLKESEAGFSYVIGQRMSLKLNVLRLVVFPRSMRDAELAQFIGEDVHARLDRLVESDIMPAKRDLQLSFSSITISKVNQLHHTLVTKDPNAKDQLVDTRQWLASLVKGAPEAIIFALPSMDMRMRSAESIDDGKRVLSYDFSSKFSKEGVKNAEDIYISLNMSLYSWLTVLRKSFAREMEQVQAAADVRVGPTSLAQPALSMSVRRKSPDILPSSQEESDAEAVEQPPTRPGRGSVSIPHSRSFPYPAHTVDDMIMPPAMQTSIPKAVTSPTPPSKAAMTGIAEATAAMPSAPTKKTLGITYVPKERHIERLTMRQLGEATPDVMHPFFMKKAGFSLEDSLPQYVHEYATMPTEEIMKVLLKLYSKQLARTVDEPSETKGLHSVSREPSD